MVAAVRIYIGWLMVLAFLVGGGHIANWLALACAVLVWFSVLFTAEREKYGD